MSSSENLNVHSDQVLVYCRSKYCVGVPIDIEVEQEEVDDDCPICIEPLSESLVAILKPCNHKFCKSCMDEVEGKCPMCRGIYKETLLVNKPLKSANMIFLKSSDHEMCIYPSDPYISNCLEEMKGEWASLIEFMFKSLDDKGLKKIMQGTELLDIEKLKNENRMISENIYECCLVCKTPEGKTQVVFMLHLNNLVLRVAVMQNEDINIESDNAYADEIVGYINVQLSACWRSLSRLMNRDRLSHIYVRKFEKVTAILLMTGYQEHYRTWAHEVPMMEQLGKAKICNFDQAFEKSVKSQFPTICLGKVHRSPYKGPFKCCNNFRSEISY